ncbi:unnamed protein product [Cyprideis torosa]|uniref:Uncharacterized protein n=1 Tax=Cyprideis torosa TaxID=163714 RepID=A0A7R8WBK2_9CRUS|nr:unnamed protein product [Cyprideis torosa]CAG0890982.1 unnamed protein product [Cyprideis torosa]
MLEEQDFKTICLDFLADSLMVLYDECCNACLSQANPVAEFIKRAGPTVHSIKNLRPNIDDFEIHSTIGRCVTKYVLGFT